MAVRDIDPKLRHAKPFVVIENNYDDYMTTTFKRTLRQHGAEGEEVDLLDLEIALQTSVRGGGGGGGTPGPAAAQRRWLAATGTVPLIMPADQFGTQRLGGRMTAKSKPIMCDLIKKTLHERRLYVHSRFFATAAPETGQLDEMVARLEMTMEEADVRQLLGLSEGIVVHGGDPLARPSIALSERYHEEERAAMLELLGHQYRGFRRYEYVKPAVDGRPAQVSVELTGKKRDGPHKKRDDCVTASAWASFAATCLFTLPYFDGNRVGLVM
jgi:hypothetical protein